MSAESLQGCQFYPLLSLIVVEAFKARQRFQQYVVLSVVLRLYGLRCQYVRSFNLTRYVLTSKVEVTAVYGPVHNEVWIFGSP